LSLFDVPVVSVYAGTLRARRTTSHHSAHPCPAAPRQVVRAEITDLWRGHCWLDTGGQLACSLMGTTADVCRTVTQRMQGASDLQFAALAKGETTDEPATGVYI